MTMKKAPYIVTPMIGGRSKSLIDCAAYWPTPCRSKTVSVRIGQPPCRDGRDHPHEDPEGQPERAGADREREGRGHPLLDLFQDMLLLRVAHEIVREHPLHHVLVLDVERLVEAPVVHDRRDERV